MFTFYMETMFSSYHFSIPCALTLCRKKEKNSILKQTGQTMAKSWLVAQARVITMNTIR